MLWQRPSIVSPKNITYRTKLRLYLCIINSVQKYIFLLFCLLPYKSCLIQVILNKKKLKGGRLTEQDGEELSCLLQVFLVEAWEQCSPGQASDFSEPWISLLDGQLQPAQGSELLEQGQDTVRFLFYGHIGIGSRDWGEAQAGELTIRGDNFRSKWGSLHWVRMYLALFYWKAVTAVGFRSPFIWMERAWKEV